MNKTGFGFLRLPRTADKGIDYAVLNPMVDRFLALGGNYFDTAYTYLEGLSEEAIRKAVVERYPRDSFRLASKLPGYKVTEYSQCRTLFNEQLERCGVDYFDVYLLHFLTAKNYAIAEQYDEFRFLREIKAEGKARKIGFSFHDGPELLESILTAHPEVDVVLLQLNYLDWDSVSLRARELYEIAVRHGKTVLVMEPVRGGQLATLPEEAEALLRSLRPEDSMASWAIRFATNLPAAAVVLSGMNTVEQMEDNMRDFPPLSDEERAALGQCAAIIRSKTAVACTACGYCVPQCPKHIPIPSLFALYNDASRVPDDAWKIQHAYDALAKAHAAASACIACRRCEQNCPQRLSVAQLLTDVQKVFEKQ